MPDPFATVSPAAALADIDTALVRAAAAGDRTAFETLYRRHVGRVFATVLRLCGHHEARAEELTQETFINAWTALPGFRFDTVFAGWLHRLAVNAALMEIRRKRIREDLECEFDLTAEQVALHPDCPAETVELERAIAALPERARAVLVLHDVEGYLHSEIAELLEIAPGTSKSQLSRARHAVVLRVGGGRS